MKTATMILGVIGSDCHAVGNKILERVFSDAGFKVINLGVMVSQDEYIDAAIETGAEVIMVSSLYGHGEIDCQGFRERCVERGLHRVIIYVGGNLVIGKTPREQVIAKFEQMGYDRVFMPDVDLESVIELLREDIKKQRLGNESISKY